MHKTLLFGIAAIICCNAFSQSYKNNWVFGDSTGLDFSGPFPISFETAISTFESCSSISDSVGNLLFYTNGKKVWNWYNEMLINGDSLHIGGTSGGVLESSLTQGVTIIPIPEKKNQFYVFVIETNSPDYGLEYSIVNMNLNGGLGEVTEKNVDIYSSNLDEKMTAIKHGNGHDWWLFCKIPSESLDAIDLLRILIKEDEIQIPDTLHIEPLINTGFPGGGATGQMKFSKNGNKCAFTRAPYLLIFDFDRCTGELFNPKEIFVNDGVYGCEFSPDARMIYVTSPVEGGRLMQFCLSCPEPIEDTKVVLYENTDNDYMMVQLQIGSDDKIYVPIAHNSYTMYIHSPLNEYISLINNPDIQGFLCDFDTLSIPVFPGRCSPALPNMPNYNLGPLAGSECDTIGTAIHNVETINNIFNIYPNPAINYFVITSNDSEFTYQNIQQLEIFDMEGKK